jgi:hypothetical protein
MNAKRVATLSGCGVSKDVVVEHREASADLVSATPYPDRAERSRRCTPYQRSATVTSPTSEKAAFRFD